MTLSRFLRAALGRPASLAARGALALLLLQQVTACNRDPCAGLHAPSTDPNAPTLVEVEVASVDLLNPWQHNMAVSFLDPDGDLSGGTLEIYVGTSEPVSVALLPYYLRGEIDPAATAGRLGIDLNFAMGGVQDDTLLRVGFQLRDAADNYSNCYSLDLHFVIDRLSRLVPSPRPQPHLRRVACGPVRGRRTDA